MVRVENVVNYTKADMDDYVKRAGLNWRISREEHHETIPAGSVISQLTKAEYYGRRRFYDIGCNK